MTHALQPDLPILVVDDEYDVARAIGKTLRLNGYNNLICISDSREVMDKLKANGASLILLDITMPHIKGDELLAEISASYPYLPVIMATANDSIELVVHCMRKGAYDFICKPLSTGRLLASIHGALELWELRRENEALRNKEKENVVENPEFFREIITQDSKMVQLFRYIEAIAPSSKVVMISGETGVGKELVARAIHEASGRLGSFVAVNVAGVDDEVFSDTLFGHIRGAYTGADAHRAGQVKKAAAGTLFLDEIGDLSMKSQVKLLRLIQEKVYLPLGSDTERESDARIIAATNKKLDDMVELGEFRRDLYYRLFSHHAAIPPLRDRFDDLPLLIDHFIGLAANELDGRSIKVPEQLYPYLRNFSFPGNIRELQSIIVDAVSRQSGPCLGIGTIEKTMMEKFPSMAPLKDNREGKAQISFGSSLPTMKEVRHTLIKEALERAEGNMSLAANLIGISRQSMSQFLKRHHLML